MRQSRVSTTMDIYAQIIPAAQHRALEQLAVLGTAIGILSTKRVVERECSS